MNYNDTLRFLYSQLPAYHRIGKAAYKNDLVNTTAFDKYLGEPHKKFRTIHIGGTNGKGSVSHMIASVLMESGYKTGLYTSPHLIDFRERIRVDGKMISKNTVINFIKRHSLFIQDLKPSFFEMTVAMAFDYFASKNVDVAVIEVGLGGRLDSTNIITPVLSVITNIGHDHMDLLGNTLQDVAEEKAGIIKPEIPVVIGESQEDLKGIFNNKALMTGSRIYFADQNFRCTLDEPDYRDDRRDYNIKEIETGKDISGTTNLQGDYQKNNIQTVFQSCSILRDSFKLSDNKIMDGIRNVIINTQLMGRWQIMGRSPLIICDTGHNREGIEYVVKQLSKIYCRKVHFIIGFVSDKDRDSILKLFPDDAVYYFTKASVPRALDENTLRNEAIRFGLKGETFPDIPSAIRSAKLNASADDLIFIGGSIFIVADALTVL